MMASGLSQQGHNWLDYLRQEVNNAFMEQMKGHLNQHMYTLKKEVVLWGRMFPISNNKHIQALMRELFKWCICNNTINEANA